MTGLARHFKRALECVHAAVLAAALGLGAGAPVHAQAAPPPSVAMTAQDLGALFDEHALREMREADIAGAAIVVVKDGAVMFARGYGHADVSRQLPVSPDHTVFRIASVSKVVTYTAVMQLVEQGKIDLDTDIARYLDFAIPAAFGKPLTMRHLMAHTAGFEETVHGRWVEPGQLLPLRDYLVRHMPRRLFAPGAVPAYSTYGTTLAGYIVERVSGEPFETYMEKHVFAPLGMRHSSFAQPLPPRLAPMLAQGYDTGTGPARTFDTVQAAPGASMSSSAIDMARFMLAHLGAGPAPGPSMLKPATLASMHSVQFRHHPAGPGIALGLYEMDEVAPRVLGHTGDIPGFHSAMYLFPEQRTGLFIVQNTEAGAAMRSRLLKAFAQRYLIPPQAAPGPAGVLVDASGDILGSYRSSWRSEAGPTSLKYLLEQDIVRMAAPGTLEVDTLPGSNGKPAQWRQVGPGTWQSVTNPLRRLYFSKDAAGEWEMSSNWNPTYVMQKSPWYRHKLLILTVLPVSLGVVALSVLGWPLSAVWRRYRAPRARLAPPFHRRRKIMRLGGLLALAPWVMCGGINLVVMNDLLFVSSDACAMLLRTVQLLAWLAVAGSIAVAWAAAASCRDRELPWMYRLHHALLSLACLGAAAMAWQCGLLFWDGRF